MPKTRVWDKHEIKAEIGRKGASMEDIGRIYGISGSMVRMTLIRRRVYTQADQAISDFLGVPLHELWPDRYDDKGHRLTKLPPPPKPVGKKKRAAVARATAN